jgi:multimeric flavodoxin WrbA
MHNLVEISDRTPYMKLTRFLVWCKKSRSEEKTEIEPAALEVSDYDILVFGSPVWAFKPTPVIHTAIDSLKGCEGKKAMAFSTNGGKPGQTEEIFRKWIESRGMKLVAVTSIHQKDIENEKKTLEIVSLITYIK